MGTVNGRQVRGLEGQWLGQAHNNEAQGHAIVDVDRDFTNFRGVARLYLNGQPGVACEFATSDHGRVHRLERLTLSWIPEGQATIVDGVKIKQMHPNMNFPETAKLYLKVRKDQLHIEWETDIGTSGEATLDRSRADRPSELESLPIKDWSEFKKFALEQQLGRYIYRGQPEAFKLRTAFHRSHRKDLVKYAVQDIPLAYKTLTARTRHLFDLTSPQEAGAFWNLLQHHGYPTPLLDWTHSPFVAAFFAYRKRQHHKAPSDKVRIFAFDKASWMATFPQLQAINFAQPHFSVLDALAIENARALPQQSVSTLSNVDDIEAYIRQRENQTGRSFLSAIDLPADSRRDVMVELSLMGITAGSLFPGLDGACEELKGRMFHPQF